MNDMHEARLYWHAEDLFLFSKVHVDYKEWAGQPEL